MNDGKTPLRDSRLRDFRRVLPALGLLLGCAGGGSEPMNDTIRVPFDENARACHERLDGAPVLEPGLQELIELAGSDRDFSTRLRAVQDRRFAVVESYRETQPNQGDPLLEGQFACAANDLLESMFAAETERLVRSGDASVREQLDELSRAVSRIELDPSWNDYARARIRERIEQAKESIG